MTNVQETILRNYIKENVENFEKRYDLALDTIDHMRCDLRHADIYLYNAIMDCAIEWAEESDETFDDDEILEFVETEF